VRDIDTTRAPVPIPNLTNVNGIVSSPPTDGVNGVEL
jgi:hypothetical protein